MDPNIIAISHAPRGMNSAVDPSLLGTDQAAKAINASLDRQLFTTRMGSRVMAVDGEWDRTQPVQGALYYDPKRGTGAQVFSDDSASIILAAGGCKYRIFPKATTATLEDITGGFVQDPDVNLIWMTQAENYVIAGDGKTSTYIFDGESPSYSTGFVGVGDRDSSSVPQGAGAMAYSNGRLWVTVDSRRILASDSLHGENLTDSTDLIKFTEQVYWATGQWFSAPSSMGNVVAMMILPVRNTRTGQGQLMVHCVNGGVFSIDTNIYPRENWANSPMVNVFLSDTAATGPYALDSSEGDQFFRSRTGLQTLRSASAESRLLGRPNKPISEEVGGWLEKDYVPYLRFASLRTWPQEELMLCTTAPFVEGPSTLHRGLVALDWDPVDSGQTPPAWLGLWTFPKPYRYIAKMVRGLFADDERMFAIHRDEDGKHSLIEYDKTLKYDILEDGTEKRITMKVETRELNATQPYSKMSIASGSLHLRDVSITTDWTVNIRTDENQTWTKWRSGNICFDQCNDPCSLVKQQPRNVEIELGKPPESVKNGRRIQFQIVITGWCRIEGLLARAEKQSDDAEFAEERLTLQCIERPVSCDDSDYSYSEEE